MTQPLTHKEILLQLATKHGNDDKGGGEGNLLKAVGVFEGEPVLLFPLEHHLPALLPLRHSHPIHLKEQPCQETFSQKRLTVKNT